MTVKEASGADLASAVKSGQGCLADFKAEWCGPCKAAAPKLEALSQRYPDVTFLSVDVDEHQEAAQQYNVSAMPTFIAFMNGHEVGRQRGADLVIVEELIKQVSKPAFVGQGQSLGGTSNPGELSSGDSAREVRARAAEARLAAMNPAK